MPRNQPAPEQSEADKYWALADQYQTEMHDPTLSPSEAQAARDGYKRAIHNAQQAETAGT
jgi:hypothetical protein